MDERVRMHAAQTQRPAGEFARLQELIEVSARSFEALAQALRDMQPAFATAARAAAVESAAAAQVARAAGQRAGALPGAASQRPLTRAEREVLAGLLHGHTAKVIARGRGASVHTVRSQIASILEKTGQRTQKALIASMRPDANA